MPLHTVTFESKCIGRETSFQVFVPGGDNDRRYPAVYVHHGLGDTYEGFTSRTNIEIYAQENGLIAVMPDAGRSWYANDPDDGCLWEDHLAIEIVELVDEQFPTISRRDARALTGFSMGGYGAMILALLHPDRFSSTASLAGSMFFGHELRKDRPERTEMMLRVAPPGGRYDLFTLAEKLAARSENDPPIPNIRVNIGIEDHLLKANRQWHDHLVKLGIPHDFMEVYGGHKWSYVESQLAEVMWYLGQQLSHHG